MLRGLSGIKKPIVCMDPLYQQVAILLTGNGSFHEDWTADGRTMANGKWPDSASTRASVSALE